MSQLFIPGGRKIHLAPSPIGSGAEGEVYRLTDTADLCAKIYYTPNPTVRERLDALMRLPVAGWRGDNSEHCHVAWPVAALRDDSGQTRGFLMPFIEGVPATTLFDSKQRACALHEPSWRTSITAAARIARMFDMLHQAGIVMGDVSPTNVIISQSGHITLIDCDTVQFTDPESGRRYAHTKITPEYGPPEAPAGNLQPSHDNFGLAIMICQLLMDGEHPFEGVPSNPDTTSDLTQDNIRLQNNRLTHPVRLIPVAGTLPPSALPPRVLELARAAFCDGHRDEGFRPAAATWADALDTAGFQLMGCRNSELHLYHDSLDKCVWCRQIQLGYEDPYPRTPDKAGPQAQRRVSTAVPQQPPRPPASQASPAQHARTGAPHHRPSQPAPSQQRRPKSGSRKALARTAVVVLLIVLIAVILAQVL